MSQPQPPPTTTTTTYDAENMKPYPARAQAWDCFLFLLFITIAAVVLCAVPVITRLLIFLQPSPPEFNVNSSSLAILDTYSNTISANWDITLFVKNPNPKAVFHDEIKASARNGTQGLSFPTISITRFAQAGGAESRLRAMFDSMLMEFDNCGAINKSLGVPCGAVNLTVELQAKVTYGGRTWPVKRDSIKVVCEGVKVEFPANVTTLGFGSSRCEVNGHWTRIVTNCTSLFWTYIYVGAVVLFILAVSL